MNKIVSKHWTVKEMTEILIAWNVINNPSTSEKQKKDARAKIMEVREVVATRLNITLNN